MRLCEIPSIAAKWQIAASLPAFGGLQQTLVNHRTELPRTLLMWVHFHVGASTRCISQRRECQPGVLGQIPFTYLLKLCIFNWFEKYIVNWQEEKQLKDFLRARGKSGGPIFKHFNSHSQFKIHILHFRILKSEHRKEPWRLRCDQSRASSLFRCTTSIFGTFTLFYLDFIFKQLFGLSLFKIALNGIMSVKKIIKDESSTVGTMNNEHEQWTMNMNNEHVYIYIYYIYWSNTLEQYNTK